jgi:hypothetical protein
MINTGRIPIRRSIVLPSFPWLSQRRKRTDPRSEAEEAFVHRKRESLAEAQRDAAHAEFFLMGGRLF